MKALRSFTVRPHIPPELAALDDLAMNLRWSWDSQTRDLFRWVDPDGWDATRHDPMRLLGLVPAERLEALAADEGFRRYLADARDELNRYLGGERWFQDRAKGDDDSDPTPLRHVAYFSPEFGIAEALPQYSGGLGVLAGDHLKASSDLGLPLVGIGLFYRHGYFRQALNSDGWQQEAYPDLDPYAMAISECDGVRVRLDLAGSPLVARIWRADVGRIQLFLLDTDIDENAPEQRGITDRLYGGDVEHRLRQEILLGIGGVRALEALGIETQVFHTNEGHAGFLGLERIRRVMADHGLTLAEAVEAVRAGNVFTTHTPVPAGIDQFPRPLMEQYFSSWAIDCGVTMDDLMALGHRPNDDADAPFNMAVMGLHLAARSNAVSKLHGEVSRSMFGDLWPDAPPEEVPITSVTNGVHAATWTSAEMADLFNRHVLPAWGQADAERWAHVADVSDDELWRVRAQGRERMIAFVRARLKDAARRRGASSSDADRYDTVLDPRALTIGFARRFATYKRATMLLSQPDRLRALLSSPDRPIQFVFAGKAHPADEQGKEMIRQLEAFTSDPEVGHRFVFVDDYDISVARALYQGADVWLNTPRRPQEACGTSGMKAALNGALNCSILDGWWDEWFTGDNGWAISSAERLDDLPRRDELEANSLFDLLEHQIVPLFYNRGVGRVPRGWTSRIKSSLASLGPLVTATRMVGDYVAELYEPAARDTDETTADGFAVARDLAAWKRRVLEAWTDVRVDDVTTGPDASTLGEARTVSAIVSLGGVSADDIEVQLVSGPVGEQDELGDVTITPMTRSGSGPDGGERYEACFTCDSPGRHGVTVRVVPSHPHLDSPAELGRMAWA
jgi:starch phosphorylase